MVCLSFFVFIIFRNNILFIKGYVVKFDLDMFEFIKEDNFLNINSVYSLVVLLEFVYVVCLNCIVRFGFEEKIVKMFIVDNCIFFVVINKLNEIISFSCSIYKVIVMDDFGEKLYLYFYVKFKYLYGFDVNFFGNIFVVGKESKNVYVLIFKVELLKIFEVELLRCIKFKENFNVCFVGFGEGIIKVYEF